MLEMNINQVQISKEELAFIENALQSKYCVMLTQARQRFSGKFMYGIDCHQTTMPDRVTIIMKHSRYLQKMET